MPYTNSIDEKSVSQEESFEGQNNTNSDRKKFEKLVDDLSHFKDKTIDADLSSFAS